MSANFTQPTKNIWFPDQEEPVYDQEDPISAYQFKEYWKRERERCILGFDIADGKVHVPGRLYFHTVYWKIAMYIEKDGRKPRIISTPLLRDIDWDIFQDLEECDRLGRFYSLVGSRDFGKALLNTSKVYTPIGEMYIGDTLVGDEIYGADGKLTTITGVYPQGKVDIYKITLLDGRVLYCCDEHLWKVWNGRTRKYEVLPLKDIRKDYLRKRKGGYKNRKEVEYMYAIPNNSPVEYEDNVFLPIDPYFLGLWLGDGTKRTLQITSVDEPIINYVKEYAAKNNLDVRYDGRYGYNITSGKGGSPTRNKLVNYFNDLDLFSNKHIPSPYFYTSVENRMELLRGLMDTDGSCSKTGTVEFSTSCPVLANHFYDLVRSLGIVTTLKKRKVYYRKNGVKIYGKDSFRFTLLTDKPIFKLERKLKYLKKHNSEKTSITSIEYFGKEAATCITVDNEDKLFLTDNYTVTHNSIIAASAVGHLYTFFNNSESVVSGGEQKFIKLATDKVEDGLTNIHPVWKKQRIRTEWKSEIRAGWKDKKSNQPSPDSSNSRILVRNYENGTKSMAANGTRPGFHLIDEIGTIKHLIACIKDSDGCWWSGGGTKPSCLVMITGTGGEMEVGAEAAEVFNKPEAFNMLEFTNDWEDGGRIGRFIPATRAKMNFKVEKTLAEYLQIDHPDLHKITILVSDEERALKEWWEPEHKKALRSGNPKVVTKFKAYWPLKPSDSFIVLTHNDFNTEAAKAQQNKLRNNNISGFSVRLYHDGTKIVHESIDALPISEFPLKTQNPDAPVVLWEPPIQNAPFGLYIAGVDTYRHDDGESLGAIYIYKRMHNIVSEQFQDMFVASYVGRPKTANEWNETARMLIKYYNAVALVENDEPGFINYMIAKGDGHYLHDQPDWIKEYVHNSNQARPKGLSRQAARIRAFLDGVLKNYLDEVTYQEKDETGSIIREVLGVSRIKDPMLLEEIIRFNKTSGNYDRIVAAELALACAEKMKPLGKVNSSEMDPRYKALFSKENKTGTPLFGNSGGMFGKKSNRLKRLFS